MKYQGSTLVLQTNGVSTFVVAPDSTLFVLKTTKALSNYQATTATLLANLVNGIQFTHHGSVLEATLTNASVLQFNS